MDFSQIFANFLTIFQENPTAQVIGFLAAFINFFAFATAKDKKFLIFMAISSFVWGVHFYLMGLFSAAFISFFDIVKNIIALKYKNNHYLSVFFLIVYVIIGIFTFEAGNYFSLLPIINSLLSIIFIFYFSGAKLKIGFLLILTIWFIYNFFGNSLGGMLSDIVLFIAGLYGLYKILQENKKSNNKQ